jgi:hypothetical protein
MRKRKHCCARLRAPLRAFALRAVVLFQISVRRLRYLCNARSQQVFKKQQLRCSNVIVTDAGPFNCPK